MSDPLDDLAALMNPGVPPEVNRVFPGSTPVVTTDEIDGLFDADDKANRHKLMAQCKSCNEWTQIEQWKSPPACQGCGSKDYDPTSYTSLRSFNPATKRISKGYKR